MKKAVTWLLGCAQCWGDSRNLLLTLNAAQMRGATVTPTTQEAAGWGTELARPGRPREEESSDGRGSEAAVKAFSSHGNQSCAQDYQKDLLAKATSLMLERLERPHSLKWNPAALLSSSCFPRVDACLIQDTLSKSNNKYNVFILMWKNK